MAEFFRGKKIRSNAGNICGISIKCFQETVAHFFCLQDGAIFTAKDVIEIFSDSGPLKAMPPKRDGPALSYEIAVPGITRCKNEKIMFEVLKIEKDDRPDFFFFDGQFGLFIWMLPG